MTEYQQSSQKGGMEILYKTIIILTMILVSKVTFAAPESATETTNTQPLIAINQLIISDKFDGIFLGMSGQVITDRLKNYTSDDHNLDSGNCYYLSTADDSDATDVHFMIYNHILSRIDVADKNILTVKNVGVGTREEDVLSAYKNSSVHPHPYLGAAGSYIIAASAHNTTITFEIGEGVVTNFWIGKGPAINLIEGCS